MQRTVLEQNQGSIDMAEACKKDMGRLEHDYYAYDRRGVGSDRACRGMRGPFSKFITRTHTYVEINTAAVVVVVIFPTIIIFPVVSTFVGIYACYCERGSCLQAQLLIRQQQ